MLTGENIAEKKSGQPIVMVNINVELLAGGDFSFKDEIRIKDDLSPVYIPKREELELTFPKTSGTSRLIYKDFSSY